MYIWAYIKKSIIAMGKTFRRFPAVIVICVLSIGISIYNIHYSETFNAYYLDMLSRIMIVAFLGIPVSLFITLIMERLRINSLRNRIIAYVFGIAFLVLYYYFEIKDINQVQFMRYVFVNISLYLAAMFIPYFYKRSNFEIYVTRLIGRFFISALFAFVLFLGLVAILFTIEKLIYSGISDKIYIDTWLIIVGIFAPIFFLARVPEFDEETNIEHYPKLLKILLLYVILPLIAAYTAVLYVYFAKVIIMWNLPKGLISYLVLCYSAVGIAAVFLVTPFENESKWVKTFKFYFIKLIFPLLAMLFLAIGVRINDYGFTENRYIILILGLWALGIVLYLNLRKLRRNIIIPVTMAILSLLIVFGPWDAFTISKFSQNQRFESILERNKMISNGKIVKNTNISDVDRAEISSILRYFNDVHKLNDIKTLPKDFKINDMQSILGFEYTYPRYDYIDNSENKLTYFSYNRSPNSINSIDEIGGYDYLVNVNNYPYNLVDSSDLNNKDITVNIDVKTNKISIGFKGTNIYSFDLYNYIDKLYKKYGSLQVGEIDDKDMIVTDKTAKVEVKYFFNNINGNHKKADKKLDISTVDFKMLIKINK
jgi:hypothetical protein